MPGLVFMRRKWDIASDDFVFSGIVEVFIRAVWIVALVAVYISHFHRFDCSYGERMEYFYIGFLVLDSIGIINTFLLFYISMQGTVSNNWPRRHIVWCLYFRGLLIVLELTWISLCTAWVYGLDLECEEHVEWTAKAMIICGWCLIVIKLWRAISSFNPAGSLRKDRRKKLLTETIAHKVRESSAQNMWSRRCEMMCCCIACDRAAQEGIKDVGIIVGDFFHDLDLVVSDMIVGMMLLVEQQQAEAVAEGGGTEESMIDSRPAQTVSVNPYADDEPNVAGVQPKEWMTLDNLAYYIKYANAAYGCSNYMMTASWSNIFSLCPLLRCCSCCRAKNTVHGDNCWQCNTAVIKKCLNLTDENLVYLSFENDYQEPPFFVAVDFTKNAVVVCIRGTFSLQDILADIVGAGEKVDIPGVDDAYIHESQLAAAQYVNTELEEKGLLEAAFQKMPEDAGLVITGHSLGSGIASALAVLLKPTYPDLMCFAFSPMGCSVSPSVREYSKDFVFSVIMDTDMIARMDAYTLTELKARVLKALMDCESPKYHIMATGCWRFLRACFRGSNSARERTMIVPLIDPMRVRMQKALEVCEKELQEILKGNTPLKLPGQLVHIVDTQDGTPDDPIYEAYWASSEAFEKLLLDSKMMINHLSGTVEEVLNNLTRRNAQIIHAL
ncbi:hypothetical protein RRG08_054861 [Elysia crispata]|uniref:sn-1-specific diacylglycerol lipase n=1 Tax=Elysia crispata TaxID=231223 RepID=A0AAE1A5U3_9GAST|nr:hypothetical protein RRG08_054861 [Elysia crispata]